MGIEPLWMKKLWKKFLSSKNSKIPSTHLFHLLNFSFDCHGRKNVLYYSLRPEGRFRLPPGQAYLWILLSLCWIMARNAETNHFQACFFFFCLCLDSDTHDNLMRKSRRKFVLEVNCFYVHCGKVFRIWTF